jgi:hypothetical protein
MNVKRALKLVGGKTAGARLLETSVQSLVYAAEGHRQLDQASQHKLAHCAADAAITIHKLRASPFVRAWVAHLLMSDSRFKLPRGFTRKTITL